MGGENRLYRAVLLVACVMCTCMAVVVVVVVLLVVKLNRCFKKCERGNVLPLLL